MRPEQVSEPITAHHTYTYTMAKTKTVTIKNERMTMVNFGKQENGKLLYLRAGEEKEVEVSPAVEKAIEQGLVVHIKETKKSKSSKSKSKDKSKDKSGDDDEGDDNDEDEE